MGSDRSPTGEPEWDFNSDNDTRISGLCLASRCVSDEGVTVIVLQQGADLHLYVVGQIVQISGPRMRTVSALHHDDGDALDHERASVVMALRTRDGERRVGVRHGRQEPILLQSFGRINRRVPGVITAEFPRTFFRDARFNEMHTWACRCDSPCRASVEETAGTCASKQSADDNARDRNSHASQSLPTPLPAIQGGRVGSSRTLSI